MTRQEVNRKCVNAIQATKFETGRETTFLSISATFSTRQMGGRQIYSTEVEDVELYAQNALRMKRIRGELEVQREGVSRNSGVSRTG